MFIGTTWPTNISHVGPCLPSCHVCSMFVGSLMNIKATWQFRPATPALRGPYVHRLTDEHMEFLKKLPILSASPAGEPPKQVSTNIYRIYNNPTSIQHVKHHKYPIHQTLQVSNTTATHQYPNITSHRMHRSSLRRVIVLCPSTACVKHRLGELFSCRDIAL
jgi:hypothetical protein